MYEWSAHDGWLQIPSTHQTTSLDGRYEARRWTWSGARRHWKWSVEGTIDGRALMPQSGDEASRGKRWDGANYRWIRD